MQHLMCFFHVKQVCQKQLRGKPMKDQKEMMKDITELHSCASFDENNTLYHRVFAEWCIDYNEFAYYFEQQWNTGPDFTNWKVFSCESGVCTTNNALESFNAMFKHSYTNHSRHTLPALLDVIMEALIVDLSREVWDAPFSARYYRRSKTGRLKSRPRRYTPSHSVTTKTQLRNKSKRKHATQHPTRTLLEFGFRQQPVHPLIAQDRKIVEKMDYSGTLVSTAP